MKNKFNIPLINDLDINNFYEGNYIEHYCWFLYYKEKRRIYWDSKNGTVLEFGILLNKYYINNENS